MLPSYVVSGSYKYSLRRNQIDTPDILVYERGAISLIFECKATRMSYEARFSEEPWPMRDGDTTSWLRVSFRFGGSHLTSAVNLSVKSEPKSASRG